MTNEERITLAVEIHKENIKASLINVAKSTEAFITTCLTHGMTDIETMILAETVYTDARKSTESEIKSMLQEGRSEF